MDNVSSKLQRIIDTGSDIQFVYTKIPNNVSKIMLYFALKEQVVDILNWTNPPTEAELEDYK